MLYGEGQSPYPFAKPDFVWKASSATQLDVRRILDGELVRVLLCNLSVTIDHVVAGQKRILPSIVWWYAHIKTISSSFTHQPVQQHQYTKHVARGAASSEAHASKC